MHLLLLICRTPSFKEIPATVFLAPILRSLILNYCGREVARVGTQRATVLAGAGWIDSGGITSSGNCIVPENIPRNTRGQDVSGVFAAQGSNLVGDAAGSAAGLRTDLNNADPMLLALADN